MKLCKLISFILLLLAVIACGRAGEESRIAVSGGVISTIATDSLVRIASQGRSFCTGVLVASDLVITAAHCITTGDKSQLTIVFPRAVDGKSRGIAELQRLRDDSLLFFPNFDIAWIRLDSPAPSNYKPAVILGNSKDVAPGTPMGLVGVANETACNPSDSECRIVRLPIKLKSIWSSSHLINLAVVESSNANENSGTCPGDSGGPAFVNHNGQSILFGIVAGKDPIFTGGANTNCGSPTSVLTRIGEYQAWIESTSKRKLTLVDPAKDMLSVEFLTSEKAGSSYGNWQDWFSKPLAKQSAWITIHKILEQVVLEFQGTLTADQTPFLFQDGGQEWVEKIKTLHSLTLGFPIQSVAIEDLRPLEGLKNLESLTFLSRSYIGLDTLSKLKKLKTISIIGRSVVRTQQGTLAWNELASGSVEALKLSQIAGAQLLRIDWKSLPRLKSLVVNLPMGKVSTSDLHEEDLKELETLQIQEFSCDQDSWPSQPMTTLKSLSLRSTLSPEQAELVCINWTNLPQLKDLSVQGYKIDLDGFTAAMPASLAAQFKAAAH